MATLFKQLHLLIKVSLVRTSDGYLYHTVSLFCCTVAVSFYFQYFSNGEWVHLVLGVVFYNLIIATIFLMAGHDLDYSNLPPRVLVLVVLLVFSMEFLSLYQYKIENAQQLYNGTLH